MLEIAPFCFVLFLFFLGKGQNQRVATFWRHKSIEIDRLNCKLFSICAVHSETRTRLDNLTKIQTSNTWISSWNAQMLHFPLCQEKVTGMPRTESEFDMVFCFARRLAPYIVFSTQIYLQHIARPVESDRSINIVFVCPSVHSLWM